MELPIHRKPLLYVTLVIAALFAIYLSTFTHARSLDAYFPKVPSFPELTHSATYSLNTPPGKRFDASGLAYDTRTKRLFTINDKLDHLDIFSITLGKKKGAFDYPASLKRALRGKDTYPHKGKGSWHSTLDTEGIARCGAYFYMMSERKSLVYRVHAKTGKTTHHLLAYKTYRAQHPKQTKKWKALDRFANAGFEGIACSQKHQALYLIKERGPRFILVTNMPTGTTHSPLTIKTHFDTPHLGLPQKVAGRTCPPDFGGAAVFGDFLYVLYRNARAIQKVDLKTFKTVATQSFAKTVKNLYTRDKPYGFAEGIVVTQANIYLIFDNNARARINQPKNRQPDLLAFTRPKDF